METYIYPLSSFSNGLNLLCMHKIIFNYGFSTEFNGITVDDNIDVKIFFSEQLTTQELENLNVLISQHNPDNCFSPCNRYGTKIVDYNIVSEISSTTETVPQTKNILITNNLIEGHYKLNWYYEWSHSSTSKDFKCRAIIDDIIEIMTHTDRATSKNLTIPKSGFSYQWLNQGNHNIKLQYWTTAGTSYIGNTVLDIYHLEF